ncbi:nucleotidyltransferase family protein [Dehalobacter sp. TeCB1]|uniref:nucleotidyltransferase domain-containing protein n=1 Tax=Dehalobacter sp. TeCB1 TaxID=1843715 RepID=UPI00083B2E50|nr:nucleotidyltransferase family protein [Dehalobacter sp. TeCB1]OCZ49452.1 hypothetical protein A7D23_03075 [Dehalobacter sp. TeCB1]
MTFNSSTIPQIPYELRFILECSQRISPNQEESNSLDWDKVLRLSLVHRLFPLLYKALSQHNLTIPLYIMDTLKTHSLKNGLHTISIAEEMVRITKYMISFGVKPIFLKGPPLSTRIGEDITLRPSGDIDILVDPEELIKTETLLKELDYRRTSPDFELTPKQRKFYFKKEHHFQYYNEKHAIVVELHWRIRSYHIKGFPSASELNVQTNVLHGSHVFVMDDTHWFIFLMVHGYKHKWDRLRWLYDIKEFIMQGVDWKRIIDAAENLELLPILHQTIILLDLLYGIEFPDDLLNAAINDTKAWQLAWIVMEQFSGIKNDANLSSPPKPTHEYSLRNAKYYNYNSKFNYFFSKMLSTLYPSEIEFKHIRLPDSLFLLYFVIKPTYWLFRRIKAAFTPVK